MKPLVFALLFFPAAAFIGSLAGFIAGGVMIAGWELAWLSVLAIWLLVGVVVTVTRARRRMNNPLHYF